MHKDVIEAIDQIDAAVFSSDTFYDEGNRLELKKNMNRWSRELAIIKELADAEE